MQSIAQSAPPVRLTQPRARVAICIATFRRLEPLRELLVGVSHLTFRKVPAPEITVVVIDNEPSGSAEDICNEAMLPWPLKYVVESRRGIAQARNRAIFEAGDVDFVAFIDDDEYPSYAWLDELLATQSHFAADVVSGPVIPDFDADVPYWVREGMFFNRAIHHSGQALDKCHSGNVLIRAGVFEKLSAFDERFALTGGEDTQFFLRVSQSGFSMVSSSRAVVHEPVTRARGNLRWVLRRAYQSGNSWVLSEISLDRTIPTRLIRLFKGFGWIVQGTLSMPISLFRGTAALARSLRNIVLGAGMLAGLAGHNFKPYESAGTELVKAPCDQ
jgi:glycosyltransferase involved in cell wall biosynthesis